MTVMMFFLPPLQAPASSVDMFGSVAASVPVVPSAEPAAAAQSLQNLQDLALMGFSDQKRYKVICTVYFHCTCQTCF